MNAENFEKWMSPQVLPNLPPGFIVVMDNALYHEKQVGKAQSKYDIKPDMTAWLERKGVAAPSYIQKKYFDQIN
jgi:hypothetical protein